MIEDRREIFKKKGRRHPQWESLKKKISNIVSSRKGVHHSKIRATRFLSEKDSRNFYKSVDMLLNGGGKERTVDPVHCS